MLIGIHVSFKESLFRSFAHLLTTCIIIELQVSFIHSGYKASYIICKFIPFCRLFFNFGDVLCSTTTLILMTFNLSIFFLCHLCFYVIFKETLPKRLQRFTPVLFANTFIAFALPFWAVMYFELVSVYGVNFVDSRHLISSLNGLWSYSFQSTHCYSECWNNPFLLSCGDPEVS